MKKIREYLQLAINVEKWFCIISLVIMLMVNFVQVVMRYVFNEPFAWSEELILILLVWFGFICMSIDIYYDSHIALTGFYNKFNSKGKKVLNIFRHSFLSVFFAFMIVYGKQLLDISLRKRLPASHLSQGLQFAPMLIGGVIMLIFSLVNLLSVITNTTIEKRQEDE
jgi:TRAP-type C4-dicarboxylate transport system permease small subunit